MIITPYRVLREASTSTIANADGTRNSVIQYTAFGRDALPERSAGREIRLTQGVTPTKYRYTGQLAQAELGLDYYVARWYDPMLGHFTQADTIVPEPGKSQSFDRYAYVEYNPVKLADPTGYDAECGVGGSQCGDFGRNLKRKFENSTEWKNNKLDFKEFLKGYEANVYYLSHSFNAFLDEFYDTNSYFYARTYSEYVERKYANYYDFGTISQIIDNERQKPESERNYEIIFAGLSVSAISLYFESDKGYGGGGSSGPKWSKEMLSNAELIAKGRNIREVEELVRAYGGDVKGWKKMKGWDEYGKEWHWYYHKDVGRVEVKPK